jgi:hypothetical protein
VTGKGEGRSGAAVAQGTADDAFVNDLRTRKQTHHQDQCGLQGDNVGVDINCHPSY